jgi:hypothetical protein
MRGVMGWVATRARTAGLALCVLSTSCATAGRGTTPPLPGEPEVNGDSDAVAGADASPAPGDDGAAAGDDGGMATDDAGGATGGTCNDPLHALKALFVIPAVPCTSSSDCKSGDCCYVSGSASTCVMQ